MTQLQIIYSLILIFTIISGLFSLIVIMTQIEVFNYFLPRKHFYTVMH